MPYPSERAAAARTPRLIDHLFLAKRISFVKRCGPFATRLIGVLIGL